MPVHDRSIRYAALVLSLAAFVASPASAASCEPLTVAQIRKNRHVAEDAPTYATYAILSNNAYTRNRPLPLPDGWAEVPELRIESVATGLFNELRIARDFKAAHDVRLQAVGLPVPHDAEGTQGPGRPAQ